MDKGTAVDMDIVKQQNSCLSGAHNDYNNIVHTLCMHYKTGINRAAELYTLGV